MCRVWEDRDYHHQKTHAMKNFLPQNAEAVTMPAIKREIENTVDELAATCSNQFTRIDQRFDQMATKAELRMEIDGLYQNMVRRFTLSMCDSRGWTRDLIL